jgi:hypothetical protein
VSVQVALRGRLGNNLFQYALGRLVAEHHGLALECRVVDLPPEHPAHTLELAGPATLAELRDRFPGAPLCLPGEQFDQPVESFELGQSRWGGQTVPLVEVLSNRQPRQVRLHGYFQRFEYLQPRISDIRLWFKSDTVPHLPTVGRRDVVVHIRRGLDFGRYGWVLPLEYYDRALSIVEPCGQVHICGVQLDDEVREHFAHLQPTYYEGSPLEQFQFLQLFDRIVLSNDTFAWWASFLSRATVIVGPRAVNGNGYAFTGFSDVDLHMRQSRYQEVAVSMFAGMEWHAASRMQGAVLYGVGRELILATAGRPAVHLASNDLIRHALACLVDGDELSSGDLARRYPGVDVWQLVEHLMRLKLVHVQIRYVEQVNDES